MHRFAADSQVIDIPHQSGEPCRTGLHKQYQEVVKANCQEPALDSIHKKERLANLKSPADPKKNAAHSAKCSGVKSSVKAVSFTEMDTPKRRPNAMTKYAKPSHKRAAKVLGYALTLGDLDGWAGFREVVAARLTDEEQAALAYASLTALDPDHAEAVVKTAMGGVA